jgi:hypothetical protein
MKAGRELDALVAEKVMGWTVDPIYRMYTGSVVRHAAGHNLETRFNPSTDITAAWEVVEKMRALGLWVEINLGYEFDGPSIDCIIGEYGAAGGIIEGLRHGEKQWSEEADTAPLAICLAALKAKGVDRVARCACGRPADDCDAHPTGEPESMNTPIFRKDKIRDALDAFYGRGKYDKLAYTYADGYYALSLEKRFGKSIEELKKEVGYDA